MLLPDAIACRELYESLNMQTSSSTVLITQRRANLVAVTLSVSLTVRSVCRSGTQNAADVLFFSVLDASV